MPTPRKPRPTKATDYPEGELLVAYADLKDTLARTPVGSDGVQAYYLMAVRDLKAKRDHPLYAAPVLGNYRPALGDRVVIPGLIEAPEVEARTYHPKTNALEITLRAPCFPPDPNAARDMAERLYDAGFQIVGTGIVSGPV